MTKYTVENGYYPLDKPSPIPIPSGTFMLKGMNEEGKPCNYWFRNPKGGYYADDADYIPDGAIAVIKDGKKMWYLDPSKEDKE